MFPSNKKKELLPQRLAVQTTVPNKKIIDSMLMELLRTPGASIELPIKIESNPQPFCLTVELELNGGRPIWTLYSSDDRGGASLWSYVQRDTDMITEVLTLTLNSPTAMSQPAFKTNAPSDKNNSSTIAESNINKEPSTTIREIKTPHALLGHLLVEAGSIPEPILNVALNLQEMINQKTLSASEAASALRKVQFENRSIEEAISSVKNKQNENASFSVKSSEQNTTTVEANKSKADQNDDDQNLLREKRVSEQLVKLGLNLPNGNNIAEIVIDLLKLAGFITNESIESLKKNECNDLPALCKALLLSGTVNDRSFEVAWRLAKHVRRGNFKPGQAVIALHYAQRCRTNFEETIHSLGWEIPADPDN